MLMVLFDHIFRHYHLDRLGRFAVADIGIFGVLLFFVHTSLVLMYSMQRSGLRGLALVKNFYIRRFFRIYPLSVLTVLAAVALHLHATGRGLAFGPRPGALELISNLLLIQNLTYSVSIVGPLWTLPLEVQMYVLLPRLIGALPASHPWPGVVYSAFLHPELPARRHGLYPPIQTPHPGLLVATVHRFACDRICAFSGSTVRRSAVSSARRSYPAV